MTAELIVNGHPTDRKTGLRWRGVKEWTRYWRRYYRDSAAAVEVRVRFDGIKQ